MASKNQVIEAIRQNVQPVEDGLELIPETGMVMGLVISPCFRSLDYWERQDLIWNAIERALTKEEQRNIGPIAAIVPDDAQLEPESP